MEDEQVNNDRNGEHFKPEILTPHKQSEEIVNPESDEPVQVIIDADTMDESEGWFTRWFKWCPASKTLLKNAEEAVMSCVATPFTTGYVDIGSVIEGNKESCKIWTLTMNKNSNELPLVLLHGLASGIALWSLNFDDLAKSRPVYALDLLGFGRSSRPNFSSDPLEAEKQLVDSIEAWRGKMKLEKFIFIGHSLGGFLGTSYSLRFPGRVAHLVLADPWGFNKKPASLNEIARIPFFHKILVKLLEPFNPLWAIRLAGPMGPRLLQKIRADLIKNFENIFDDAPSRIANYIFQCNARNPTGESAFHAMMTEFGWAKHPMYLRIPSVDKDIPLTLIYGSRSWVDHYPAEDIINMRQSSYVKHHVLEGAGHHVYTDKKNEFNQIVIKACMLPEQVQEK